MVHRPAKPFPPEDDREGAYVAEVAAYLDRMTPEERARLDAAERLDRAHGSTPEDEPDDAGP